MALVILSACTTPAAPGTSPSVAETAPAEVVAGGTETTGTQTGGTSSGTGTLRVGMEIPVQLDPAFAAADVEIAILNAVYDYLVDVDAENNIQPRLATSWESSEDGLSYTFTLSPDATFHDGSPVTAADVVWTFDRLRDPV